MLRLGNPLCTPISGFKVSVWVSWFSLTVKMFLIGEKVGRFPLSFAMVVGIGSDYFVLITRRTCCTMSTIMEALNASLELCFGCS
ncbi:hypothetical protein V6N13_014215 [Hibiscus sabdariffa]